MSDRIKVYLGSGTIRFTVTGVEAAKVGLTALGVPGPPGPSSVTEAMLSAAVAAEAATRADADATLTTAVAGKAATVHAHAISDVTGLQAALDAAGPSSTSDVPEGANLYHTSGRVNALIEAALGAIAGFQAFGKSLLTLASAAALRTAVALPTSTTVGRLARYTDTAGAQGQTAGIYEDASGNVGIGTTAPAGLLTVAGAVGNGQIQIKSTAGTGASSVGLLAFTDSADARQAYVYKEATSGDFVVANESTLGSSNKIRFVTGGNTRLTIEPTNGNVGIGTTSPAVSLDVNGPIRVKSYTVATVPNAAVGAGQAIFVTNEVGGACFAYSDSTNWRRMSDGAIIS